MSTRALSADEALKKAERYCAYQERCTAQVEAYLRRTGITSQQVRDVTDRLKDNGFIDDQRFACAWVRGKLRNNGWGRIKLALGLKALHLEEEVVAAALEEIDEEQYRCGLEQLLQKKLTTSAITPLPEAEQHMKVLAWAYGKGYETGLIKEAMSNIKRNNRDKDIEHE